MICLALMTIPDEAPSRDNAKSIPSLRAYPHRMGTQKVIACFHCSILSRKTVLICMSVDEIPSSTAIMDLRVITRKSDKGYNDNQPIIYDR